MDLTDNLSEWGFTGDSPNPAIQARSARAQVSYSEFKDLTADRSGRTVLTMPQFVGHAVRCFGMDPIDARAAFMACDVDESGMINKHEYIVLREALTPPLERALDNAACPAWAEAQAELRARALFFRYSSDGVRLTAVNRAQLVQRLGAGVHHVTTLLDRHLGWDRSADDDKFGPLTMERFIKEVAPNLTGDAGLSVRDFIPDSASRQFQSPPVVLDPRCHVLSVEDSRGGSVPVGDDEGDVFRTATRKNSTMAVFNEGCVVHESLRCEVGSDWRGALSASRDSPQIRIARTVIARARIMATQLVAEKMDVLDNDWMEDEKADHQPLALQSLFDTDDVGKILGDFTLLSKDVQRLAAAEPRVLRVHAPARVFGDIHGQLRDLLLLLGDFGFPDHIRGDIETVSYVFNGDFIDRGGHQASVVALLFALKVMYPARIALVRGNHEFEDTSDEQGPRGFREHVARVFGREQSERLRANCFHAFARLPLAAVIDDAVLVLHGGIGTGEWGLDDLAAVPPVLQTAFDPRLPPCIVQALWSDPTDSDADMARGVHSNDRGEGVPCFGPDVTESFCAANGIQLIIRSHQWVECGFKIMHRGRLITLFSARNYSGELENAGSILLIAKDEQGRLRVRPKTLAHQRLPDAAGADEL